MSKAPTVGFVSLGCPNATTPKLNSYPQSMVTPVSATPISDEWLACLNLSGVHMGHAPRHDESRAWRS